LLPDSVVNVDYCTYNQYCASGVTHIACTYPRPKLDSNCPPSDKVEIIDFTQDRINLVLDTHNTYRNIVASGQAPGYPPALKMLTLHWEDQLAYFSEANTRQCRMKHDPCRKSRNYTYVGQNICQSYSMKRLEPELVIKNCIDMWYLESQGVLNPAGIINKCCLNPKPAPLVVGHFTQMVIDRANAIGCAMMINQVNGFWYHLFTCDYNSGTVIGFPVYRLFKTRTGCKKLNPTYSALCSEDEVANPNQLLLN
jgi:hypothetical protein